MSDEDMMNRMKEVLDLLSKGYTFGEINGFTEEEIESIYSIGYTCYQTGKYDEAENVFRFLCAYDHLQTKYSLALGGALQAQRKFAEAAAIYANILLLDFYETRAYYHIAECQLALGDRDEALSTLEALVKVAKPEDATAREYRAKAEETIGRLKQA